ncbi:MAG TPA: AAA family ATPase, partial [Saprospiraceae bacterium]|nr:AAA family ATPase [Saprospiraceae bacterium]
QNAAYAALANAFRGLMRQLLGEPKNRLDQWSEKITQALDVNAQLIVDLVPELALIIGKQPPVQDLSPAETQNRFLLSFVNFVKVFANEEHPFVIFMDDLQWSDIPTLNLLSRLATSHELSHLLLIGAFRDNEVDTTHPLSMTLREIQGKRYVENLSLQPLSLEATNQLTKETLLCDDQRSLELSQIFYEKTGGNPFFTIELLKNLKDSEVIFFNSGKGGWDWDITNVRSVNYSDNVIDILVASQSRLTAATQHVLQLAACIGATFDLKTLSIIREDSMEVTGTELQDALKANMVVPLNESYKFFGVDTTAKPDHGTAISTDIPSYKFQHDRVQQAAYSLIDPQQRQALHLSIGRLILNHSSPEELDERLMDMVGHFNEGRTLVVDKKERRELGRLNLAAGIKAKQSSAYESALGFLKTGYETLGEVAWTEDYDLAWKLNSELQHCFYLTGDWKNADLWSALMLENSKTAIEKGLVLSARTRQYATTGRMQDSMTAAFQGLSILGFEFNQLPTIVDVNEEVEKIAINLRGEAIGDLINRPDLTDEKARIASQLIMEIFAAAFLSASGEMFPYLVLKSVNIALEYGNSPETAFSYGAYGMILCGMFDDPGKGYQYGRLAVNLIEKYNDIALKSRIIYVYAMFVHHWSNHWTSLTPLFRRGIEAGYQSGDLLYLAYSAQDCVIWDPQLDLETASQEHRKMLDIVKQCEYQDSYDSGTLFLQMQLNFQGLTASKFSMTDNYFNEEACVEGMYKRHFMTGISNYHIYKAEIHLLYNDPSGALEHVIEQEKLMSSVMSLPQLVRFHIVAFLVRSMLLQTVDSEKQEGYMTKMQDNLEKISDWAKHCPENFEHLRLLMEAELANFEDDFHEALSLYELAIAVAHKNNWLRDEAMANEMTARFLLRFGLTKAAEGYLQSAHYLFYRWAAHRKVEDMEANYAVFSGSGRYNGKSFKKTSKDSSSPDSTSLNPDQLDISSVLRASQTISGELVLDKLLKATLQILIENAAAQKGFIVEHRDGHILIQAQNEEEITGEHLQEMQSDHQPDLPITLIN